jgi:hypothetical protein
MNIIGRSPSPARRVMVADVAVTAAPDDALTSRNEARVAARAAGVVLALSVVLAGLEVGRVAVLEDSREAGIALMATCAFLPLHAWRLRYGVRGARAGRWPSWRRSTPSRSRSSGRRGRRLFLSPATVRNYLSNAMSKLGARNRIDAIRIAREAGWL